MSSIKTRQRTLARKGQDPRLTARMYRGELYFMERLRRPVTRGRYMIMTDVYEPVSRYESDDYYWVAEYLKINRHYEDPVARMLKGTDESYRQSEIRETEIADDFERELDLADRAPIQSSPGARL